MLEPECEAVKDSPPRLATCAAGICLTQNPHRRQRMLVISRRFCSVCHLSKLSRLVQSCWTRSAAHVICLRKHASFCILSALDQDASSLVLVHHPVRCREVPLQDRVVSRCEFVCPPAAVGTAEELCGECECKEQFVASECLTQAFVPLL